LTRAKGSSAKSKHDIQYPNLPLAIPPDPQDGFPIPKPPSDRTVDDDSEESFSGNEHGATNSIIRNDPSPHLITQQELHDLVRDLKLSQTQSELLAS
jgi:hypothetical protein